MKKALLILSLSALIWACSDKESSDPATGGQQSICDSIQPNYTDNIAVVLDNLCTPCHTSSTSGGINVSGYANAKATAQNAKFLAAIKHESGAQAMPQGQAKLSDNTIQLIECWIENGFPEN